jgi:hypothetical protein
VINQIDTLTDNEKLNFKGQRTIEGKKEKLHLLSDRPDADYPGSCQVKNPNSDFS